MDFWKSLLAKKEKQKEDDEERIQTLKTPRGSGAKTPRWGKKESNEETNVEPLKNNTIDVPKEIEPKESKIGKLTKLKQKGSFFINKEKTEQPQPQQAQAQPVEQTQVEELVEQKKVENKILNATKKEETTKLSSSPAKRKV
jgi:hypothetical protein